MSNLPTLAEVTAAYDATGWGPIPLEVSRQVSGRDAGCALGVLCYHRRKGRASGTYDAALKLGIDDMLAASFACGFDRGLLNQAPDTIISPANQQGCAVGAALRLRYLAFCAELAEYQARG